MSEKPASGGTRQTRSLAKPAAPPPTNKPITTKIPAPPTGAQPKAATAKVRTATGAQPRATGKQPAAAAGPSKASMKLRKHLMIGIIGSCVILTAAIVVRIVLVKRREPPINVASKIAALKVQHKNAADAIFREEAPVWTQGKELTPEAFAAIRENLKKLEDCDAQLHELAKLLQDQRKTESKEMQDINKLWLLVKFAILDASDLVEDGVKPPDYAGFYIPMWRTSSEAAKLKAEMGKFEGLRQELMGDPDEATGSELDERVVRKEEARKRLRAIEESFAAMMEKFAALDDYVIKGLAREDLKESDLQDLGILRAEANQLGMNKKAARDVRFMFRD